MIRSVVSAAIGTWMLTSFPADALATEWFVSPGSAGTGTKEAPLGAIQAALRVAQPGDTVIVRAGTYEESVRTVRDGSDRAPITIRTAGGSAPAVLTTPGTALQIDHSFVSVEGLVIDAAYAPRTAVNVRAGVRSFVMRNVEVRRSGRDCVNISAAVDVRIENSRIHHCLNPADGRTDAHGIVAGAVRGLTIRDTDIYAFSGDAVQLNRTGTTFAPGWDEVLIEQCRFWLAPLGAAANGFPAGSVPGENAVDTKVAAGSSRARITIRNTQAWGFRGGSIRLQAAFNLKEQIDATVDGVTVWDSEIAFRVRGGRSSPNGAWVRIQNVVIHDVSVGIRYENDIQRLRVWNTTFGRGVTRAFAEASSPGGRPEVRNVVVLGPDLPSEAIGASNLAVGQQAFVDAASHDYRLAAGSPAIDAGTTIREVATDRARISRPQGPAYDVGAHEWCALACTSPPP